MLLAGDIGGTKTALGFIPRSRERTQPWWNRRSTAPTMEVWNPSRKSSLRRLA